MFSLFYILVFPLLYCVTVALYIIFSLVILVSVLGLMLLGIPVAIFWIIPKGLWKGLMSFKSTESVTRHE